MLLDQAGSFAARASAAGVAVTLQIAPDMIHDWHLFAALFPQARESIEALAKFTRERIATPSSESVTATAL